MNAPAEIRVWLDDVRAAPAGWTRAHTASEAITFLEAGGVVEISLDHDLGDEATRGTGYDVVCWIEEAVATRGFAAPEIHIHSANVVGRERMQRAIDSIERLYWATNDDLQGQLRRSREPGRPKIPHAEVKHRLGLTIEAADERRTLALRPYVEKVLTALGHPEAFVTDESLISDFLDHIWSDPKWTETRRGWRRVSQVTIDPARLPQVIEKLGVPIDPNERVVDVALRLRNRGPHLRKP
jgi:hypothetical protein